MLDLKDKYMERAEELAYELYGKFFYDLSEKQRSDIWSRAEQDVHDKLADEAEAIEEEKFFNS